jgi:hypothetical protein
MKQAIISAVKPKGEDFYVLQVTITEQVLQKYGRKTYWFIFCNGINPSKTNFFV